MPDAFDVAVIGYGPTGMAAAALLAQRGHRVVVIERWPGLYGLPRLTHIDDDTARILQEICDIDVALADMTPTVYEWVNGQGQLLLEIPTFPGTQGYSGHMSIYQPDIESAIDTRLRELPGVEIRQGWVVTAISQNDDQVEIETAPFLDKTPDMSRAETIVAKYAIGADGNKSLVRSAVSDSQTSYDFEETWVNFDVEWLRDPDPKFGISKQYCDPARGHMYMGIGHRRQRFEFALLPDEDPADFADIQAGWDWLERAHGLGPADVHPVRYLQYTFFGRNADRWRNGRIFIAGDAAHVMPPYLGQGACSGIRDASNLAWKLDLVLTGDAADSLLDSYQEERRPHADHVIQASIGLGHVANMKDPQAAKHRDEAFMSGSAPGAPPMPRLTGAALAQDDRASGTVAPQGAFAGSAGELRGDDVLGHGFQVIARGGAASDLSEHDRALLNSLSASILDLDSDSSDLLGRYIGLLDDNDADLAVIRPDHIVFGVARRSEAPRLLEALRKGLALPEVNAP